MIKISCTDLLLHPESEESAVTLCCHWSVKSSTPSGVSVDSHTESHRELQRATTRLALSGSDRQRLLSLLDARVTTCTKWIELDRKLETKITLNHPVDFQNKSYLTELQKQTNSMTRTRPGVSRFEVFGAKQRNFRWREAPYWGLRSTYSVSFKGYP